jgi:hypothetical protein
VGRCILKSSYLLLYRLIVWKGTRLLPLTFCLVGKKKNKYTKAIAYRLKVPFKNSLIATDYNALCLISKDKACDYKGTFISGLTIRQKALNSSSHKQGWQSESADCLWLKVVLSFSQPRLRNSKLKLTAFPLPIFSDSRPECKFGK